MSTITTEALMIILTSKSYSPSSMTHVPNAGHITNYDTMTQYTVKPWSEAGSHKYVRSRMQDGV